MSDHIPFSFVFSPVLAEQSEDELHPRAGHEDIKWEYMYSSPLSSTSVLDCSGWPKQSPGRFPGGKAARYPLYRRMCGPQGLSGRVRKISPPPGFDPGTLQLVASPYTD